MPYYRTANKAAYAITYRQWLTRGRLGNEPDHKRFKLTAMAAQSVRITEHADAKASAFSSTGLSHLGREDGRT
jgi:hypothetical protein